MKIAPNPKKYVVYVDDNFNFMDESERYKAGEYNTQDEAIAKCKEIVERSLAGSKAIEKTAEDMYESYTMFGEDPFIIGPKEVSFSVWDYAKERCDESFNK